MIVTCVDGPLDGAQFDFPNGLPLKPAGGPVRLRLPVLPPSAETAIYDYDADEDGNAHYVDEPA